MTAFERGFIAAWLWATPLSEQDCGRLHVDGGRSEYADYHFGPDDTGPIIRRHAAHAETVMRAVMASQGMTVPEMSKHGQLDMYSIGHSAYLETSDLGAGLRDNPETVALAEPYRAIIGDSATEYDYPLVSDSGEIIDLDGIDADKIRGN